MRIFKPKSNMFNMSHQYYTTLNFGDLVPFDCLEVLPGDTWKLNPQALCRFEALEAPTMMNCKMYVNYFYVPNRLIYEDWDEFQTRGKDGTSEPVLPYLENLVVASGSLADYFGLPKKIDVNASDIVLPKVSVLPFRAYNKIINDWVLHDEIETERVFSMASGKDTTTDLSLFTKGWSPDRFTNCLPYPQLGPDVKLPLGDTAPVVGTGKTLGLTDGTNNFGLRGQDGGKVLNYKDLYNVNIGTAPTNWATDSNGLGVVTDASKSGLKADLSATEAGLTMRQWRLANALQKFFELNARIGNRATEYLLGHWGVRSDDLRLQRSEYLGGCVSNVVTSEVLQTSQTTTSSAQGTMAGHAWTSSSCKITRRFKEHGWIIGLVSVMPQAVYSQGLEKKWSRQTIFDFADPLLAHLSEQPVYKRELVAGTNADDDIFGYLPIYEEYRHVQNRATSNFTRDLSYWVGGQRIFVDNNNNPVAPSLNTSFLRGRPSNDIFPIQGDSDYKHLRLAVNVEATAVRKLAKEGIPL